MERLFFQHLSRLPGVNESALRTSNHLDNCRLDETFLQLMQLSESGLVKTGGVFI
ncbi:MAG: hypothetical protein R3E08_06020 [Thiotrichaceae bacterium]